VPQKDRINPNRKKPRRPDIKPIRRSTVKEFLAEMNKRMKGRKAK